MKIHQRMLDEFERMERELPSPYQRRMLEEASQMFDGLLTSWEILTSLSLLAINSNITWSQIEDLKEEYKDKPRDRDPFLIWLAAPFFISTMRVWDMIVDYHINTYRENMNWVMNRAVENIVVGSTNSFADILNEYFGMNIDGASYQEILIEQALTSSWSTRHFSASIWRDSAMLQTNLKSLLTELSRGQLDVNQAIVKLRQWHKVTDHQARRMLYTEFRALVSRTNKQMAIHNGILEFELIATLDERTSEICEHKNHTFGLYAGAEIGVHLPPFHPWCRTIDVPVIRKYL